jgi:tetratricopeptide (TPR) repeat protein
MFTWLLALSVAAAGAQHDPHAAAAAPPAALMAGLGHLHHPISTRSADAQQFFDQGLTLVYAFNHDEAIRSFKRAAELDPASPMPHWGIALALGPNINLDVDAERERAAFDAAQRAARLALHASSRERAYVDAIVKRYSSDPKADLKALAVDYKNAMRALAQKYPKDLDAQALYAESLMDLHPWQLWSNDGKPTEGTEEIVAVLEGALKQDPTHVGANHYYIHAVEASPAPGRALASARRLETLVPAAGHLVHMPSHIYMRTGEYRAAVTSNERAAEVDRAYIERTGVDGVYPVMYYAHNLDFLASAAMMSGQAADAIRSADALVAHTAPALAHMPMLEPFAAKKLFVLLRFARWSDVLALPAPEAKYPILTSLYHFGRGVARSATGEAAGAEAERASYTSAKQAVPADADWGYNKAAVVFRLIDAVLDARVAHARHDQAASIAAWRRAVAAQDGLNYDEPPDWFYPVRESLGAELIRAGQAEEAVRVFDEDLARNPRNPRSLFGRWQALLIAGRAEQAFAAEKDYKTAWAAADVPLRLADF